MTVPLYLVMVVQVVTILLSPSTLLVPLATAPPHQSWQVGLPWPGAYPATPPKMIYVHSPYRRCPLNAWLSWPVRAWVSGPHKTETIGETVLTGYHPQGTIQSAD